MAYSAISKSSSYMNTVLYTGDGSGATVSGVGFQPDLNWTKSRSNTLNHAVTDAARGVQITIYPNLNSASDDVTNGLTAFNADGYVHGDHSLWATNSATYASWNWKAGTTSGLTGGTITPSAYSFSTTSGLSIIKWAGTGSTGTIPHGLGAVPRMIIVKDNTVGYDWRVYHASMGNGRIIRLNTTGAEDTGTYWNNTTPTSTVFSVAGGVGTNDSGSTMVAYCFADVKGFSKFGEYKANDVIDGPFIYTGFQPAWIMIKEYDVSGNHWHIYDNKREGYNEANDYLEADDTTAEQSDVKIDMLSNGFKIRSTGNDVNEGTYSYIYAAFAAEPLVANVGTSIPATAR